MLASPLLWLREYYANIGHCILDNVERAQNSYDKSKTKQQKYTKTRGRDIHCVSVAPFWN